MLNRLQHQLVEQFTLNLSTPKRSEVDMRVAQELKNNQDFIYQTNQSLQNLRRDMSFLTDKYKELFGEVGSNRKMIEIEFDTFCDKCNKYLYSMDKRQTDYQSLMSQAFQDAVDKASKMSSNTPTKDEVNMHVGKLSEWIISLQATFEKASNAITSSIQHLKSSFKSETDAIRKDLTPVTPEEDPVKKEVDRQLKDFRVDFQGLVQEIERLKKASAYDQKKFENLYTLIERLKAR